MTVYSSRIRQKVHNFLDWSALTYQARYKYSQLRSFLGKGYYIWTVQDGIQFVSRSHNTFSHILYVCKGHEKFEMNWCVRWLQEGDAVVDCGANIGYFSAFLSQACLLSQIIAIEGNEKMAHVCQQNLDVLKIKNVDLIYAVLCANSKDSFYIPDKPGKEAWQQVSKVTSTMNPIATTLDEVISKYQISPSLVKIDCEGFEPQILKGSSHLLECQRPAFMIECNDEALHSLGNSRKDLFSWLRHFGYRLFHLSSFDTSSPIGVEIDEEFKSSAFNFAAISDNPESINRWNQSIQKAIATNN